MNFNIDLNDHVTTKTNQQSPILKTNEDPISFSNQGGETFSKFIDHWFSLFRKLNIR